MSKRWEFRKDGFVYDVETNERVCSPHSTLPDSIKKFGPHKQDLIANARLIAAAPELLDELIEQDKFLGVLAGTVPLSEKDTHRRIAMHCESLRAAIAKATGSV